MGFIKIYRTNFYVFPRVSDGENFTLEMSLDTAREEAVHFTLAVKGDALIHLHTYSDNVCKFKPNEHEVYRSGKRVSKVQLLQEEKDED